MRWVRLIRSLSVNGKPIPFSYLTYKLPSPMEYGDIENFVCKYLAGWSIVEASVVNPDEISNI